MEADRDDDLSDAKNAATGRRLWRVSCFADERRRRFLFNRFCHSRTRYRAEAWARRVSGCAVADAFPIEAATEKPAWQK